VTIQAPTAISCLSSDGTNLYGLDTINGILYLTPVSGTSFVQLANRITSANAVLAVPSVGLVYVEQGYPTDMLDAFTPDGSLKFLITTDSAQSIDPSSIATDGTNIYWSDVSGNSQMFKAPLGATSASQLETGGGAANGGMVYDSVSNMLFMVGNGIVRCAVDGSGCGTYYQPSVQINGVAVGGGNVFWTEYSSAGTGGLFGCPSTQATCTNPVPMATGTKWTAGWGIYADSSYVYWVSVSPSSNQGVYRCPVAGCLASGPELVSADAQGAETIVGDSNAIYWSAYGQNSEVFYRIAKEP
jgi:hypothetical protein